MKNFAKVFMAMMVVFTIFSVRSTALANDLMDLGQLFQNVNATYVGKEAIIPYFKQNDTNQDMYYESLAVYYRIFKNNTTTLLYNSTPKAFAYPAVTCTNPTYVDNDSKPNFVHWGKWATMTIDMGMECNSATGNKDAHNVAVYEADVSKAGGAVRVLNIINHELLAVELVDYNSDGKKDLLLVVIPSVATGQAIRVIVKDFDTWATLSDKAYATSNVD